MTNSGVTEPGFYRPNVNGVCVPAFNEAEGLTAFHQRLVAAMEPLGSWEAIYIDDGSDDATREVVELLQLDDPRIALISLSRNIGKEIATTAGLSPFHFHRRFTDLLGLTPKQFLLDCQIHEAKTKLVEMAKELSDIARECGFAHQSHFTSRFKQVTGYTPTRWRRMILDREESRN